MATVNRYLCPVAPGECPSSPRRGFCPNHEWERLVPDRAYLTAERTDQERTGAEGPEGAEGTRGPEGKGEPDRTADAVRTTDAVRASDALRHRTADAVRASDALRTSDTERRDRPEAAAPAGARRPRPTPTPAAPPADLTRPHPTPAPSPGAPCLALVLAGALIPVRGAGQDPTRLGREAPDCAHVPGLAALDQVSRAHAELYWHAGSLYVADTDSVNGTYVDGLRISRPAQLWPGGHRLRLADDPEGVDVTVVELDEYGAPL